MPPSTHADIGVLVVHGIGEQAPGETRRKLLDGLARYGADLVQLEDGPVPTATVGSRTVRFYEVYWAGILKGEARMTGAFVMDQLQDVAWFPWWNARRGTYVPGDYPRWILAWWTLVLPPLAFLVLVAYTGARLLAMLFEAVANPQSNEHRRDTGVGFLQAGRDAARRAAYGRTPLDRLLDEYAGDLFSYVNSAGGGFSHQKGEPETNADLLDAYPRIIHCFHHQLLAASDDGCSEIHVVAHSLGTVVTYHALSSYGVDPGRPDGAAVREAVNRVRHIYTTGSPLEKIRFLWPRLRATADSAPDLHLRWDNFVSWCDPVAGRLRRFDAWGRVVNHRMLGGGFITGHVAYERSPVFLASLFDGLSGGCAPLVRPPRTRWRDGLLLLGETLVTPLGLAAVLLTGVAVFVAAAALLPFFVSLALRLFVSGDRLDALRDTNTLVLVAVLTLALNVRSAGRASAHHRAYWSATRSARDAMSSMASSDPGAR